MLYSPSPTRIVSTHQSESSPGYSDIHPIEDDPERRFYRELEDRSDDEMDGGGGDEYYTPTHSPRESNDSDIERMKKSRGSPKKINAAFREERVRSKPYSVLGKTLPDPYSRGSVDKRIAQIHEEISLSTKIPNRRKQPRLVTLGKKRI